MTQSLRPGFGGALSKSFFEDVLFRRNNYYYFLGKIEPWGLDDNDQGIEYGFEDETERKLRSKIVFAKKISPSEVTQAVKRYDWESGVVYDMWDQTVDLRDRPFYVLNSEFGVFKCLDNSQSTPSTVQPVGKPLSPLRTADGYLWKYMYTIPPVKRARFLSFLSMPVQTALTDEFYNSGKIKEAVVLEQGSGYTDQELTTLVVTGTTTGQDAEAEVTVGLIGEITGFNIINGGSGYDKGVKIEIIGNGVGAAAEAVVEDGEIVSINVIRPGVSYDEFSTVVFVVGQARLKPIISRETGSIESVLILDPGFGYNSDPTITISEVTPSGTGKYAGNSSAIILAKEKDGKIDRVVIVDPGVGYQEDSSTTIAVQGDGEGAVFSPVVDDGKVVAVYVENQGTGYNNIQLTVNSATGSGAKAQAIINQSDLSTDQFIVEQTAERGKIFAIVVDFVGSNYSSETYVEIEGNGTGCTAIPVITDGRIESIKVTNYGEDYTRAEVVIIDPLRDEDIAGSSSIAVAHAVMTPDIGHGRDAVEELYARDVIINSSIKGDLTKYNINQDYRVYGIIQNPKSAITGASYTKLEALVIYNVVFDSTAGLSKDDVLVLDYNRYMVVEIFGTNALLSPLDCMCTQPVGILTLESDPLTSFLTTRVIEVSDFNKYSGKLMYVSTETPFNVSEEQALTIKTTIKF
jgi:hypothetical protein